MTDRDWIFACAGAAAELIVCLLCWTASMQMRLRRRSKRHRRLAIRAEERLAKHVARFGP